MRQEKYFCKEVDGKSTLYYTSVKSFLLNDDLNYPNPFAFLGRNVPGVTKFMIMMNTNPMIEHEKNKTDSIFCINSCFIKISISKQLKSIARVESIEIVNMIIGCLGTDVTDRTPNPVYQEHIWHVMYSTTTRHYVYQLC